MELERKERQLVPRGLPEKGGGFEKENRSGSAAARAKDLSAASRLGLK